MCIISGDAKQISSTEILAFPTWDGLHQVTVYSNMVQLNAAGDPVAMILPFPEGPCQVIDTTGVGGTLFAGVDSYFPTYLSMTNSSSRSKDARSRSTLAVNRSGSYRYSVVPGLADFDRVDKGTFDLTDNVADVLRRTYAHGFSFLVCIIDKSAKYDPIAYRHRLRQDRALFIPTLHEHGHRHGHGDGDEEWDHRIYTIGALNADGEEAVRDCTDLAMHGSIPFCIAQWLPRSVPQHLFLKLRVNGRRPNRDMYLPLAPVS